MVQGWTASAHRRVDERRRELDREQHDRRTDFAVLDALREVLQQPVGDLERRQLDRDRQRPEEEQVRQFGNEDEAEGKRDRQANDDAEQGNGGGDVSERTSAMSSYGVSRK